MPVLDAAQAAALARDGVLLDARATPRYRGETEPVDRRAATSPGQPTAPFPELTRRAQGHWLAPARLREAGATVGRRRLPRSAPIAVPGSMRVRWCSDFERAGVTSRQRPAALYAGSWSHWCTDPARPVATGLHPG